VVKWKQVLSSVRQDRISWFVVLKMMYSALYGLYTVTLNELKCISQASAQKALEVLPQTRNAKTLEAEEANNGFKEKRRGTEIIQMKTVIFQTLAQP
jgi:hypothetical protein